MRQTTVIPIPVKKVLEKMGTDIKNARIRRRITVAMMAQRAGITRPTLAKVERGDPATSLGVYAKVLFVLGLIDNLSNVADIRYDKVGMVIDTGNLPKRVNNRKQHD